MPDSPGTSTARNPDLDWSQVRETINMLTLAVAQIECSMTDGEKSVAELTQSFTYIAGELQKIVENDAANAYENSKDASKNNSEVSPSDIHNRVVNAIMAFQFYDRLSQRLDHVKRDLVWLSDLVGNPQQLFNPQAWSKLQEDIMSNYSMEEERIMFQHIMNGATTEEALEVYRHHFEKKLDDGDQTSDEVDLF